MARRKGQGEGRCEKTEREGETDNREKIDTDRERHRGGRVTDANRRHHVRSLGLYKIIYKLLTDQQNRSVHIAKKRIK